MTHARTPLNPPTPATQHAAQITAVDTLVVRSDHPVPEIGPTQILVKMEACGICFSDTKLMHAFADHPRKGPITSGIDAAVLAEIPSYSVGTEPIIPGHEPVGVVVAIGDQTSHHVVGQRVMIQTDYRALRTRGTNAAFGYTFDGGLAQYALLDERVCTDPDGNSYNLPVSQAPSAAAVALCEPWACVEASYSWGDRVTALPGGRAIEVSDLTDLPQDSDAGTYDDIVYRGAQAATIEALADRLAPGGVLNVVLNGAQIDRSVQLDLGRVHYDGVRYTGTTGDDPADGYRQLRSSYELQRGDRLAVLGAAGAMGLMHTIRAISSGTPDLMIDALDDPDRQVDRLALIAAPAAERTAAQVRITGFDQARDDYTYVVANVRSLVQQALAMAGRGALVNLFAGFAVGTRVEVDLQRVIELGIQLVGTSGSRVPDMVTMVRKVESGELDTTVSMVALSGMAGLGDAIEAVRTHTSGGKIMVYPQLVDLGYLRLEELADQLPEVAAELNSGMWTKRAEDVLLGHR